MGPRPSRDADARGRSARAPGTPSVVPASKPRRGQTACAPEVFRCVADPRCATPPGSPPIDTARGGAITVVPSLVLACLARRRVGPCASLRSMDRPLLLRRSLARSCEMHESHDAKTHAPSRYGYVLVSCQRKHDASVRSVCVFFPHRCRCVRRTSPIGIRVAHSTLRVATAPTKRGRFTMCPRIRSGAIQRAALGGLACRARHGGSRASGAPRQRDRCGGRSATHAAQSANALGPPARRCLVRPADSAHRAARQPLRAGRAQTEPEPARRQPRCLIGGIVRCATPV